MHNKQVMRIHRGDSPTISCNVTPDQSFTFSWERLRDPMPRSVQTSGAFLKFQDIDFSDAGTYLCKATNKDGITIGTHENEIVVLDVAQKASL
jgi:Immunoglobulin I-set domain